MKSFGSYISKYLVSFVAFILILLFLNAVVFGLTFQKIVTEDYGDSSPQAMLEMCRKITQFKMSHYFQKGILRITRFLFGTPMMGCWCWAIPQTATQNSPAITIPLQHFNDSPSLCWGCLAWICCASFQPITFPNAESFTIPNRLCPL